jgi:rod shape-determining protein MreD
VSARQLLIVLAIVVTAVILQTTLFVTDQIRPFDASPDLIILAVIVGVGFLDPEPGIFLGFTAGLLADLLGGSLLGMWALSLTVVAYLVVRLRERVSDSIWYRVAGLFVLTLIGQALYLGMGTLFGQQPLRDPNAIRIAVLTALYTMIVGLALIPLISWTVKAGRPRRRGVVL